MEKAKIALSKLQKDIQDALRLWYKPDAEASPFDRLQIFQQARLKTSTNREATNKILLKALEILESARKDDAALLRKYFFDGEKMRAIARSRNISEPTAYRKKDEAIKQLALILQTEEIQARDDWQARLERRLDLPPFVQLIGLEDHLSRLSNTLASPEAPWLVSINGLGGIGKTALANALIRQPGISGQFHDIAWVSAKQQNFLPGIGLEQVPGPALQADALTDALLEQLDSHVSLSRPPQQKRIALTELLKKAAYLIVIDNLETVVDYQAILPVLPKLANPSKFLLTSRHSLRAYPDVFCLGLKELNQTDTICFIRQEIKRRGISDVIEASESQLESIYGVVGGNPLAIKLVVGQMSVLSLSQVLENLKQVRDKKIEELYTYIYWQAWHMLDTASQKTFLMMPLAQDGTANQLMALTQLDIDALNRALQQLAELSLVQVGGNLEERRYTIHRLTETFLLNETIEWKPYR